MGVVAVSAWRDALVRDAATWVRHPTALGDTGFFVRGQPPVRLASGGKSIVLTPGSAILHRRDDRMFRVTTGAGGDLGFSLFTTRENLAAAAEPRLYTRIAPNQFLRLRAAVEDGAGSAAFPPPGPPATLPPVPPVPVRKAMPIDPEEGDFPNEIPEKRAL